MTSIASILPVMAEGLILPASPASGTGPLQPHRFDALLNGTDPVSARVFNADALVKQFTLNDGVPVHQVTFALEQARLSLELMVQVRNRLIEGYQQLMNMQL